jgi:hypothetical protein
MRGDVNHREVFSGQLSLGEDFALILEAFADAFRGIASAAPPPCDCPKATYAGWR